VVERVGADEVIVRWPGTPAGARVPVFAGDSPDRIDRSRPVAWLDGTEVAIDGLTPGVRPFFEIARDGDASRIVAERRLPLEGAHNFRDLGGYRTADGHFVRWGRLYRSDDLAELTDADLEALAQLRLRWICDFRGPDERDRSPDRLPATAPPEVEVLEISGTSIPMPELRSRILSGDLDGIDMDELLIESNVAFATRFAHRYRTLFERIAEPENLPAVIHCTAGKDRTGLAAALILLSLGVPRETVFADYLATNDYVHDETERRLFFIRIASFLRTDPDQVRPLFRVRREYLQAAFDAIEAEHGTIEGYLRDALGITAAERERLRELLLR
jgi:protein-tyrosine phosphatase